MTVNGLSTNPYYQGKVIGTPAADRAPDVTPVAAGDWSEKPSPSYMVNISQGALKLSEATPVPPDQGAARSAAATAGVDESAASGRIECKTCKNRKYQDVSNDSTVSFQTPTTLAPAAAESLVRAHEMEHVNHEQTRAEENGNKVVSQTVAIHYGVCPECGRSFVSGGTTTTVTRDQDTMNASNQSSIPRETKGISIHA